ncbi:MAG: hypothetical protein LBC92_04130, partial [Rickettsiales bacterium]|nr:hypothetical protein [Rickettsiales bacterium]
MVNEQGKIIFIGTRNEANLIGYVGLMNMVRVRMSNYPVNYTNLDILNIHRAENRFLMGLSGEVELNSSFIDRILELPPSVIPSLPESSQSSPLSSPPTSPRSSYSSQNIVEPKVKFKVRLQKIHPKSKTELKIDTK